MFCNSLFSLKGEMSYLQRCVMLYVLYLQGCDMIYTCRDVYRESDVRLT